LSVLHSLTGLSVFWYPELGSKQGINGLLFLRVRISDAQSFSRQN